MKRNEINYSSDLKKLDKSLKLLIKRDIELSEAREKINSELVETKKAKLEVEKERNKTKAIIANFLDPIIVVNNEREIVLFNEAARNILGLKDENIDKKILQKKNSFSLENFLGVIRAKISIKVIKTDQKKILVEEEVIVHNSGDAKPDSQNPFTFASVNYKQSDLVYRVMTVQVCLSDNTSIGFMKLFYNITREKMIDQLKSEFISIAAHQLRTPLSAIKWAMKMLLDGDLGRLTKEQEEVLNKGYISNERIIDLVNDMLDVSRIEDGRFGFKFSYHSLFDIIEECVNSLKTEFNMKWLKFKIVKEIDSPQVFIDRSKFITALRNIFENAIKYSPEYSVIEMNISSEKNKVLIKIKDNGVGIPEKDKDRLFTKFFRGENVVRMQTEGSGLGLFIVKNIIIKHGGSIDFTSKEGKGTEFIVRLPINK